MESKNNPVCHSLPEDKFFLKNWLLLPSFNRLRREYDKQPANYAEHCIGSRIFCDRVHPVLVLGRLP